MRQINALTITVLTSLLGAVGVLVFSAVKWTDASSSWIFPAIAALASLVAALASLALSRARWQHPSNPKKVFLIYRRSDIGLARELAEWLRNSGYEPWLDVDNLIPGQQWKAAISSAMLDSSAALVIVPPDEGISASTQKEISTALSVMRSRRAGLSPVIPVLMGGTDVPDPLKGIQAVDFRTTDGPPRLAKGLNALVSS